MADSLLREVDEALRADRAQQLWRTYRSRILFIIAALIFITAATSVWKHYREARGGEIMMQFSAAQQLFTEGKLTEAAAGYADIAKASSGEVRDLAQLWQARALLAADKDEQKAEAITVLKSASANGGSLWSDIACLRLAGLDAAAAENCLAANTKSPLASERAEWAAANAWANGKPDDAINSIEAMIADESIDEDSRTRLTQWLSSMKAEKGSI